MFLQLLLKSFLKREGAVGAAYLINKAVDPTTKWGDYREAIKQNEANALVQNVAGHLGIDTSNVDTSAGANVTIQK